MKCSKEMLNYFKKFEEDCFSAYKVAQKARKKGIDPSSEVEITLAKTLADRVIGLISVIAPQLKDTNAPKRIRELEEEYGALDWRVALKISEEIAQEKFCKFKDKREAIEIGIKVGFAYVTVGVVSAPIEGLTTLEIKKRRDNKGEYFCLNFAGPVRNAGGTAAAVSVIIGDYLRKKFGYAEYDPDEKEIKRCFAEITDYHERVTNLQYFPSEIESEFLMKNIPVEIGGEPSEKWEVSNANLKDLPRIPTNILRSGYCLIHSSCIPLKAPKLWAKLQQWGPDFDMEHWNFLEQFLQLQKKSKAAGEKTSQEILPDYTYIKDLVSGRPVLSHPLASGGFRIRYGRSRVSGFSAQSIHPATMHVLSDFVASATQLKVERPGKAAAMTACDMIDGPIVKLNNGNVLFLETEEDAKKHKKEIKEILYLGDVLINYGDFFDRAHPLVPPGYCEEFWALELEQACKDTFGSTDITKLENLTGITNLENVFSKPKEISLDDSIILSEKLNIPLHPKFTFFWNAITKEQLLELYDWVKKAGIKKDPFKVVLPSKEQKRTLELLGIPHLFVNDTYIVIDGDIGKSFLVQLGILKGVGLEKARAIANESTEVLTAINNISKIAVRDKAGTFMGARMGRPEKAKMRKMRGSPHCLFPVGEEGGRHRSIQGALEKGKIVSQFRMYKSGDKIIPFSFDPETGKSAEPTSKVIQTYKGEIETPYQEFQIDIRTHFRQCLSQLNTKIYPDLIKGVKGTTSKEHCSEPLSKGILRAMNSLYVNKDGTIRYDCSEIPLTHFKPHEINVSVSRLKELNYTKDIYGKELKKSDQILELKPQDIVLPCAPDSPDEKCDDVLFRTTVFVDELLKRLYKEKPFYKLKDKKDLVGHYVIGLAPHTSAGMLGRIIGFSKTQGFFAHPLFHAAMRRDCDGDESCLILLLDALLNFSAHYLPNSRGATMDAPLVLTYILNPSEVDDMVFNMDIVDKYPLELYQAAMQYKMPWEVEIKQVKKTLGTNKQFEGSFFTHDTENINAGVNCSAYKILPSMDEKLEGQMLLAKKIRAVDEADVARLVIEKHFIRDTKGNLRKFSQQQFRCVKCNDKFRRPPLMRWCPNCKGKIIFTVSEGFITKYLDKSLNLSQEYDVPVYLKQSLELLKRRVEDVFGKEKEKQEALSQFM